MWHTNVGGLHRPKPYRALASHPSYLVDACCFGAMLPIGLDKDGYNVNKEKRMAHCTSLYTPGAGTIRTAAVS